jgi:asparagine synthetase B (glutamine-hydrolysing)
MTYKTDIVSSRHERTGQRDELDLEAICAFAAIGYFMEDKTYYRGFKSLPPASVVTTDDNGTILRAEPYFKWHYSPRDISLKRAVSEFADLFEGILSENKDDSWTIPISGGLDSRTLVAAASHLNRRFKGYSYAFRNGHDETMYGKRMSELLNFDFTSFVIESGTLWNYIGDIAGTNQCYSEFTNGRQYAVYDKLKSLGGTFVLGHMGDLIFDDMHVPEGIPDDVLFDIHWKRTVKPHGFELGERLWRNWNLTGDFGEYLRDSMRKTFDRIDIKESNPKLRAFKSWTHVLRWTSTNLGIFRDFGPNLIPYLDNRMIEFICTVPEKWLSGRQIQIEYLKMRSPSLSRIPWQSHLPFNLYNYRLDRAPINTPYRAFMKMRRVLEGRKVTTRNWEIQFLGPENEARLGDMLTGDTRFNDWIPAEISRNCLEAFLRRNTPSHFQPVTMLLTLSAFMRYLHKPAGATRDPNTVHV